METMNDKVTHDIIDTAKIDKEWLDALEKCRQVDGSNFLRHKLLGEEFDRLISMARQGINYQTIEIVDGWTIEDLVAKVDRYEKALREIKEELHHKKWSVDRYGLIELIVTKALDEDKE